MHRLEGALQHYAWGSTHAIPELLGLPADQGPVAELWLGAHRAAPSTVAGRSLADIVAERPAQVGEASVRRFGPVLPYLLKVLAAERSLSLQAHPTREQAEEGFAREQAAGLALDARERSYQDAWPKPEALCALGGFDALHGFADPARTAEHFARLGLPAVDDLVRPLTATGGAAGLREVFVASCELAEERRDVVDRIAAAAWAADWRTSGDADFGLFCRTAIELAAQHPGDPGVIAALLMNRVRLEPGEGIYLPAGTLHAYLRGVGVEVMASSDNVLRGGLTPKYVDVAELVRILDFSPSTPRPVEVVEHQPGVFGYLTPAPEFALWRVEADGSVELPAGDRGRIVLVTHGSVAADGGRLERGQAAWVEAGESLVVTGSAQLFVAAPGV